MTSGQQPERPRRALVVCRFGEERLRRSLERAGYTVLEAHSPAGALAIVEVTGAGPLDAVIITPAIPGRRRLAERLRALRPDVRLLVSDGQGTGVEISARSRGRWRLPSQRRRAIHRLAATLRSLVRLLPVGRR